MQPILLPSHKIDLDLLARWTFRRALPRVVLLGIAYGILGAALIQRILGFDIAIAGLIALGLALIMMLSSWRKIRDMYRSPGFSQFQESRTMKLDEKGYEIEYRNGLLTRVPWAIVRKAQETREFFVIHAGLGNPMPIPISILTPEALALIRQMTASDRPSR